MVLNSEPNVLLIWCWWEAFSVSGCFAGLSFPFPFPSLSLFYDPLPHHPFYDLLPHHPFYNPLSQSPLSPSVSSCLPTRSSLLGLPHPDKEIRRACVHSFLSPVMSPQLLYPSDGYPCYA
jgi:hypothetical protein